MDAIINIDELVEWETKRSRIAHQMEDDRRYVGCIRAWRRCRTPCGEQEEFCPSNLAFVEPFAQELVLNGLKRSKVAANWRRDERGE